MRCQCLSFISKLKQRQNVNTMPFSNEDKVIIKHYRVKKKGMVQQDYSTNLKIGDGQKVAWISFIFVIYYSWYFPHHVHNIPLFPNRLSD